MGVNRRFQIEIRVAEKLVARNPSFGFVVNVNINELVISGSNCPPYRCVLSELRNVVDIISEIEFGMLLIGRSLVLTHCSDNLPDNTIWC